MKITLIIPPSSFLSDDRVFMTLGILKVAAMLKKFGEHVEVLDLSGIKNYTDVIDIYSKNRTDVHVFGLTATTPQLPPAMRITEVIRANRNDAKIILGGPHVTLTNAAFRRELNEERIGRAHKAMDQLTSAFDVIVAGDGEYAIFAALKNDADKIIDADKRDSELFLTNKKLTELPWPARELVDVGSYHYTIDGIRAISLIAQLGCPFGCGFCGGRFSDSLRKIRMRTSESIVAEMVHLHKVYGFNGFMLYDDELNVNPTMVELMNEIADAQRKLGVEWRLRGFIKSQLFNDVQAEAMYRAGFRWILVGFESGSEAILTAINKKATRDENTRCMMIAKRHNLKVKALMSIGHPGESRETVQATRDWLLEVRPEEFDATVITCYPGTPYYDLAQPHPTVPGDWMYTHKETGAKLYQKEVDFTKTAEYYKGRSEKYRAYVYTDDLSSDNIVKERNSLEKYVRNVLGIPFPAETPETFFEHSMGQHLPPNILRVSDEL